MMIPKVLLLICILYFLDITRTSATHNAKENSFKIEKIAEPVELGEGPHWDVKSQTLYYVDILNAQIIRYDPATGDRTYASLNRNFTGVVVPVEGTTNQFVAGVDRDVVIVTWDSEKNSTDTPIKTLASLDTVLDKTRINDGKCDPSGRFWAGTQGLAVNGVEPPHKAALYRIGKNGKALKVLSPISISNGLTWSLKKDVMYYIDSYSRQIWSFDYNDADGTLHNKKVIFHLNRSNDLNITIEGVADGMTNDADGNLWVALYNGNGILKIDPTTGKLLQYIELPANKVTSVAFGGPKFEDLYVTTARTGLSAEELKEKPDSGALFRITGLGVRGVAPHNYRYEP